MPEVVSVWIRYEPGGQQQSAPGQLPLGGPGDAHDTQHEDSHSVTDTIAHGTSPEAVNAEHKAMRKYTGQTCSKT